MSFRSDDEMKIAFEKAILDAPYDKASRMAFADWLYERGLDHEAEWQASWTPARQKAEEFFKDVASRSGYEFDDFIKMIKEGFTFTYVVRDECWMGDPDEASARMGKANRDGILKQMMIDYRLLDESHEGDIYFSCSC